MRFVGVWYTMDSEVKRDYCDASDSTEASEKIHAKYAGRREPALCLTVTPVDQVYGNPENTKFCMRR